MARASRLWDVFRRRRKKWRTDGVCRWLQLHTVARSAFYVASYWMRRHARKKQDVRLRHARTQYWYWYATSCFFLILRVSHMSFFVLYHLQVRKARALVMPVFAQNSYRKEKKKEESKAIEFCIFIRFTIRDCPFSSHFTRFLKQDAANFLFS